MLNYVLYKMQAEKLVIILLVAFSVTASAGWDAYPVAPQYVPQLNENFTPEANNPWYTSSMQNKSAGIWSQPDDLYQQQKETSPLQHQLYSEPYKYQSNTLPFEYKQNNKSLPERYVTPEIIDSLNRQEAQYYYDLQRQKNDHQWIGSNYPSLSQPQAPDFPIYGMGGINPIYDVPLVSPWANAPDVIYRGEESPLLPNEAFDGLPPMATPLFGDNRIEQINIPTNMMNSQVFNPFTFLQNGN